MRYVAASAVTDTHTLTTIMLAHATRVNYHELLARSDDYLK